jgi:inner membrane protein
VVAAPAGAGEVVIATPGALLRAPLARIVLLAALVLLLQAPSCMIGQLARERQQSRDEATAEIAQTWGAQQRLAGPILVVPYRVYGLDEKGKRYERESGAVAILPERLEIAADAKVETLRRGLFEIPVYRSSVKLAGRFKAPGAEIGTIVPRDALLWDQAKVVLKLSDVHAIDRVAPLVWGGLVREFHGGGGALGGGLHASVAGVSADEPYAFSIDLSIRGSDSLQFAPSARSTSVTLGSSWPHPSFNGAYLPDHREVRDDGFGARWSVTSIAAGLPSAWKAGAAEGHALDDAGFGVQLLYPVDPYRMSERTLKYNLLFIGLAFVVMWLVETKTGRPVSAIQYLLLGAALCLFYLLELSLAEHIGFAAAYASAAAAVTAQVSLYARAVLRSGRLALALAVVMAGLYALLYRLLGAEDYALLLGSASLFVALSLVMFLTRRVSWNRSLPEPAPVQ